MHSYVFVPVVNDQDCLVSFFINSYRARDERVLLVDLGRYIEAVELVKDHKFGKMASLRDNKIRFVDIEDAAA